MIDTVPEFSFRKLLLAAGMFLRYVLNVDGKKYNNINIYAFTHELKRYVVESSAKTLIF